MEDYHLQKSNRPTSADAETLESKEGRMREQIAILEGYVYAAEQNEKRVEQERQRLWVSRAESYQTLVLALSKIKKELPTINANAPNSKQDGHPEGFSGQVKNFLPSNLTPENLADIQALEEQIKQDQKKIDELKEKQQSLIRNSLTLFVGHKNLSDEIFQQLKKEKADNTAQLQQYQALCKKANETVEKLKEESEKQAPDFKLCNQYVIEVEKCYQEGYRHIITLIAEQPRLQSIQIHGDFNLSGAFSAGGNIYIGHGMTINQACQSADNALQKTLEETEKQFDEAKAQHDVLQKEYQEKEEELALSKEALKLQQDALSQREQIFFEEIAKAQQDAESSRIEAEQTKRQAEALEKRVVQLEAETTVKSEQIEKTTAKNASKMGLLPSPKKQAAASNHSVDQSVAVAATSALTVQSGS
jgi:hypothetical protein